MMRIIAGEFRSRILQAPRGDKTRPTTGRAREALFNMLTNSIEFAGASILDLYAGSGALAFEALSRGASHATLVDNGREAVRTAKANAASLGIERRVAVMPWDALKFISRPSYQEFDLILADPPYTDRHGIELATAIFGHGWLAPNGLLVIEQRSGDRILPPPNATILRELNAGEAGFTILAHKTEETISPMNENPNE
jgi:16S rRNA (guanine966-N2)-methyltransferase